MSTLSQPGESQIETVVVPRTSDLGGFEAVSYTHLTLPTILLV